MEEKKQKKSIREIIDVKRAVCILFIAIFISFGIFRPFNSYADQQVWFEYANDAGAHVITVSDSVYEKLIEDGYINESVMERVGSISYPAVYNQRPQQLLASIEADGANNSNGEITGNDVNGTEAEAANEDGFISYMIKSVLSGSIVEDGDNNILNPYESLDKSFTMISDALADDSDLINSNFYSLFQAFALTLMIIYWLINMASRDLPQQFGGNATIELYIKPFLMLITAMIFMLHIQDFLHFFFAFSQGCYEIVKDSSATGADVNSGVTLESIYAMIGYDPAPKGMTAKFANIWPGVQLVIAFIVPFLITAVTSFIVLWVVLSRAANIVVTGVMAPLACADLVSGKSSIVDTVAFGYIKHFAGLCFQSVAIAVVYRVSTIVMSNMLSGNTLPCDSFGGVLTTAAYLITIRLVVAGLIIGSANISKRLFGAG